MNNTQADSALEKFAAAWDAVVHIGGSEQAVMIMEAVGDKEFGNAFASAIAKDSHATS